MKMKRNFHLFYLFGIFSRKYQNIRFEYIRDNASLYWVTKEKNGGLTCTLAHKSSI
jgi:hypothetical protein